MAKQKQIGIWKNYSVAQQQTNQEAFDATVVRILGGDAIAVELAGGKEKKITLSSLRAPQQQQAAFYLQEAKEFLRSRLIGNKVHVSVDYIRPASDGFEEKICATVKLGSMQVSKISASCINVFHVEISQKL